MANTGRAKGSDMYVHIKEDAGKGIYNFWPMDYKILAHLEEEGALFGGAYPIGHTVKQLQKEVFGGELTVGVIFPRMNRMQAQGLVLQIRGVPGANASVWQRTERGKQIAEAWIREQEASDV